MNLDIEIELVRANRGELTADEEIPSTVPSPPFPQGVDEVALESHFHPIFICIIS